MCCCPYQRTRYNGTLSSTQQSALLKGGSWTTAPSRPAVRRHAVQQGVQAVIEAFDDMGLQVNATKSTYVTTDQRPHHIHIQGTRVQSVQRTDLLGVDLRVLVDEQQTLPNRAHATQQRVQERTLAARRLLAGTQKHSKESSGWRACH